MLKHFTRVIAISLLLLCSKEAFCDPENIVVIVHKNNPIVTLDKRAVKAIFMGQTAVFPETEEAVLALDQAENSEIREDFYLEVTNKTSRKIDTFRARYLFTGRASSVPTTKKSSAAIKELVSSKSEYIGYIRRSELDDSVSVVYEIED